jgi:hypothetical protein
MARTLKTARLSGGGQALSKQTNFHVLRIQELLKSYPNPRGPTEEQRTRWIQLQNEVRAAKREVEPNEVIHEAEKYIRNTKKKVSFASPVKKVSPKKKKEKKTGLQSLTVVKLRIMVKEKGLKNYSKLNKAELIKLLSKKKPISSPVYDIGGLFRSPVYFSVKPKKKVSPKKNTLAHLKSKAKSLGLKHFSELTKSQLMSLIQQFKTRKPTKIEQSIIDINYGIKFADGSIPFDSLIVEAVPVLDEEESFGSRIIRMFKITKFSLGRDIFLSDIPRLSREASFGRPFLLTVKKTSNGILHLLLREKSINY